MNNYPSNVIPINRKSAGTSAGGKKVGGQFAAINRPVSPVKLGRRAAVVNDIPASLLFAQRPDPRLVSKLQDAVTRGATSSDPYYYEEEFAKLVPSIEREEAAFLYCRAMDIVSDGEDPAAVLEEVAVVEADQHPGGALAEGYSPPSIEEADRGERMHPVKTGSNYTEGWRDVASISKDIRGDLKAAVAANYLPAGLSYSVKSDKYAGGQALHITVQGLADKDKRDPVETDRYGDPADRKEVKELRERLETIAASYNREDRDNYISGYYSSVYFESDSSRADREKAAAERKDKAAKK